MKRMTEKDQKECIMNLIDFDAEVKGVKRPIIDWPSQSVPSGNWCHDYLMEQWK